jgi:hypothetical protein
MEKNQGLTINGEEDETEDDASLPMEGAAIMLLTLYQEAGLNG